MADNQPALFRKAFGALRPVTPAAHDLMATIPDKPVRVDVKGIRGNTKRIALYYICVGKACELLSDAVDGVLSVKALDRKLRRDLGLATPIVSKRTGEIVDWDYDSIAFVNMTEAARMAFIDEALERLSRWIGCDVSALRDEGESEIGKEAA